MMDNEPSLVLTIEYSSYSLAKPKFGVYTQVRFCVYYCSRRQWLHSGATLQGF